MILELQIWFYFTSVGSNLNDCYIGQVSKILFVTVGVYQIILLFSIFSPNLLQILFIIYWFIESRFSNLV